MPFIVEPDGEKIGRTLGCGERRTLTCGARTMVRPERATPWNSFRDPHQWVLEDPRQKQSTER